MYDSTDDDQTTISNPDDPIFAPAPREVPIVMRLRSTDRARRAMRRAALRYAIKVLRRLGYVGAALALEVYVRSEL